MFRFWYIKECSRNFMNMSVYTQPLPLYGSSYFPANKKSVDLFQFRRCHSLLYIYISATDHATKLKFSSYM